MQLHVVSLGISDPAFLEKNALLALQSAHEVIGSTRQIEIVRNWLTSKQILKTLPKLSALKLDLAAHFKSSKDNASGNIVALLASGDALYYGIGRWLSTQFPNEINKRIYFYCGISSVQVACNRLGWSLQDAEVISLHGRPKEKLLTKLRPNKKLIILTDKSSNPHSLAQLCHSSGYGKTIINVCESLGTSQEIIRQYSASFLTSPEGKEIHFNELHVSCLELTECQSYLPKFPGIEDRFFITDRQDGSGMLTKREVRLNILSLLEPNGKDCIWDIGAGCGGVSVELSYWQDQVQIYAIEHHSKRLSCLYQNKLRFGVISNLNIVEGSAPEALSQLPNPNKVFIGGSGGNLVSILEVVWKTLPNDGILVVSAITESTKQVLFHFCNIRKRLQDSTLTSLDINVSRSEELAGEILYRPNLPVRLFKFEKSVLRTLSSSVKGFH